MQRKWILNEPKADYLTARYLSPLGSALHSAYLPGLGACWLSQMAMLIGGIGHVRDNAARWLKFLG